MLCKLHIENFAILSDLTLSFEKGLTVFSGETGAGKSIVIEALGFVLGARGDVSLIKEGAERLLVSAEFTTADLSPELQTRFALTQDTFTLRRELDNKGKGKASVNGKPATVTALAQIGKQLVDFHGQHDHQSLLHTSVHLQLLDRFSSYGSLLAKVKNAYTAWQASQEQYNLLQLSEQEKARLTDLYSYQLNEIEQAEPSVQEDEKLEQILPKIKYAGRLAQLAAEAYEELYEAENSATSRAGKTAKLLENMAQLDEQLLPLSQQAANALIALEETASSLADYKENLQADPEELDRLLARHEKLKRLKAKYGPTMTDVLANADKLRRQLDQLQNTQERKQELEKACAKLRADLLDLSYQLHDKRMASAKKLADLITHQIKPLGFAQIKFAVAVEMDEENLGPSGADKVEFLFSPNPGQSLRPLKDIASGGEISRVMLGLKTVLASDVPVMVFDEVDAGIGGETGHLVGEKLRAAAQGRQVLCVTHLAQVAAQADHHFHVEKTAHRNETSVSITSLNGEELTMEIARMLGGNTSKTSAAFKHAQELLSSR